MQINLQFDDFLRENDEFHYGGVWKYGEYFKGLNLLRVRIRKVFFDDTNGLIW